MPSIATLKVLKVCFIIVKRVWSWPALLLVILYANILRVDKPVSNVHQKNQGLWPILWRFVEHDLIISNLALNVTTEGFQNAIHQLELIQIHKKNFWDWKVPLCTAVAYG